MSKITPDHLARQAYVYVRQSTPDQLLHNHESRRRQYGLADRARQLGWSDVVVVDDDLGRSGGGIARPGFERLLVAICEAKVGIVLAVEASRLARNGRDWHTLLEFCGLVGCLLADEDGVYDARLPNDRLLLGMKGTMSEMELSILRQRSLEALRQKAQTRRVVLHRRGRLRQDPARPDREGSGPAGPRGDRPGVPQVRRVPEHPAGSSLAAAGADPAAGRRYSADGREPCGSCRSTTPSTIC